MLNKTRFSECSLRQGAGGAEFARFGSRTCFLMWFYKRSQTYFGQKSEEHVKTIKKHFLDVKNNCFCEKQHYIFCFVFLTFPAPQGPGPGPSGPIWAGKILKNKLKSCFTRGLEGACHPALSNNLFYFVKRGHKDLRQGPLHCRFVRNLEFGLVWDVMDPFWEIQTVA